MKITEIIPDVIVGDGMYKLKNIFYKYHLATEIEDKYLQVYRVSDGETLEDVSNELYGSPEHFWTIIIVNGFMDPIFDMALPEEAIQEIARDMSEVDGVVDDSLYATNYDDLTAENDAKRNIKVIRPAFLSSFLTEMIRKSVNT